MTKVRWHLLKPALPALPGQPGQPQQQPGQPAARGAPGTAASAASSSSPAHSDVRQDPPAPRPRHGHVCQYVSHARPDGSRTHQVLMFWGGHYGILSDGFAFDLDSMTWTQLSWSCKYPEQRRHYKNGARLEFKGTPTVTPAAACASTKSDDTNIFMFGGMLETPDGDVVTNELYHFDAASSSFSPLLPVTRRVLPSPRLGASATFVPQRASDRMQEEAIYTFGGISGNHIPTNEFHVFNLAHQRWYNCELSGQLPKERESHSAVYWASHGDTVPKRRIVVYGGFSGTSDGSFERLSDIAYFDLLEHKWTTPLVTGRIPPGRSVHTSVVIGSKMVVFGGWEPADKEGDAAALTDGKAAADMDDEDSDKENKHSHAYRAVSKSLDPRWQCSNAVHVFDLERDAWESVSISTSVTSDSVQDAAPLPRTGHASVAVGNMMIVMGGNLGWSQDSSSQQCTNDVWALEVGPPPPTGKLTINPSIAKAQPTQTAPADAATDAKDAEDVHVVQFAWEDEYAWIPSRTYRLQVQDQDDQESRVWRTIYEGAERSFTTHMIQDDNDDGHVVGTQVGRTQDSGVAVSSTAASGSLTQANQATALLENHAYLVRVVSVNFAGTSSEWEATLRDYPQDPLILKGYEMFQAELPVPPSNVSAVLAALPSDANTAVADSQDSSSSSVISVSWSLSKRRIDANRKYLVQARAVCTTAATLQLSDAQQQEGDSGQSDDIRKSPNRRSRGAPPAKRARKSLRTRLSRSSSLSGSAISEVAAVALAAAESTIPKDPISIEGDWTSVADTTGGSVSLPVSSLRDLTLVPALESWALLAKSTADFAATTAVEEYNAVKVAATENTSRKRTRKSVVDHSADGDVEPASYAVVVSLGMLLSNMTRLAFEIRVCSFSADEPSQPSEWTVCPAVPVSLPPPSQDAAPAVAMDIDMSAPTQSGPVPTHDAPIGDADMHKLDTSQPQAPNPQPHTKEIDHKQPAEAIADHPRLDQTQQSAIQEPAEIAAAATAESDVSSMPVAKFKAPVRLRRDKWKTPKQSTEPQPQPQQPDAPPSTDLRQAEKPAADASPDIEIESVTEQERGAAQPAPDTSAGSTAHTAILTDEDGLPLIGHPAQPFYLRLKFGDRIEIMWIRPAKSRAGNTSPGKSAKPEEEWYPGRALYYRLTADKLGWRIKVHFDGWGAKADQFITLNEEGLRMIRPWSGSPEVLALRGSGTDDDDSRFDAASDRLWCFMNNAQKQEVKDGKCAVWR
ncbi:hypothetical protein BC831DRAFT_472355 [Entophlyctis helioformis]|nr:hypothetical protein BC831DRAFT_472355 [Entophlyctis helioformis]